MSSGHCMTGKKIILGVTGGIAAYKAVEVASRLRKAGAEVQVIMTRAAQEFVTELTFREITGNPVNTGMWGKVAHWNVEHIALAQMADLVLVAPATANLIAKLSVGMADDMLTTTILATRAPVFLAPAMNSNMFSNPVTQRNLETLRAQGMEIIPPASGHLACGVDGVGRLPEPVDIVARVEEYFCRGQSLKGRKILVTAGGTIAPIDPVRFIGNRSSGKMGYAVAEEAARRGAEVVLVLGVSALPDLGNARTVRVETTEEMRRAVLQEFPDSDAVIKAAAVADYRVKQVAGQKIKKSDDDWSIELVRNPDILYELGQKKEHQVLVGFAAETQNLMEYAKKKLDKKNLDFIVANDVTMSGAGFQGETNIARLVFRDGRAEEHPMMKKSELACVILDHLEGIFREKCAEVE